MIFLFKDYPDFQRFWPGYSAVTGFEVRMSGYRVMVGTDSSISPSARAILQMFHPWDSRGLLYRFVKENYPEALL